MLGRVKLRSSGASLIEVSGGNAQLDPSVARLTRQSVEPKHLTAPVVETRLKDPRFQAGDFADTEGESDEFEFSPELYSARMREQVGFANTGTIESFRLAHLLSVDQLEKLQRIAS